MAEQTVQTAQPVTTYPHIEKLPGEPARLKKTPHLLVKHLVAEYLGDSATVEQMCRRHPGLTLAEGYMAMVYYYDHIDEIERDIWAEYPRLRAQGSRGSP